MDSIRRTILTTGAAATAVAATRVFAQQAGPEAVRFYEKDAVRIRFESVRREAIHRFGGEFLPDLRREFVRGFLGALDRVVADEKFVLSHGRQSHDREHADRQQDESGLPAKTRFGLGACSCHDFFMPPNLRDRQAAVVTDLQSPGRVRNPAAVTAEKRGP